MAWWLWPERWWLDIGVLLLAAVLDLALPEPPSSVHPVVWMGKLIDFLERVAPRGRATPPTGGAETRPYRWQAAPFLWGLGMAVAVPAAFGVAAGWAGVGLHALGPAAYVLGGAVLLKTTFTVRGLAEAGLKTGRDLEAGDLRAAREDLRSLVSRDATGLSAALAAGAAAESVAENTTDSFVAPWLAFAAFGFPGAFAYRAINTLDSMIGYRGRYEYLGKASARLDDLVNLIPARLSAMLMIAASFPLRLSTAQGWRVLWRDHIRTASPNAGWTMSAASGLLGVRLVKEEHYAMGNELPDPCPRDVARAVALMGAVAALALAVAVGVVAARHVVTG